jgi:hypothetical protein
VSRRVAIYCRGKAVRANRAAVEALRDVALREGWTVVGAFVERMGPSKLEYDRFWRGINANDIDMVAVPSLAALADGVSEVITEILRLRDADCDLYVLEPNLNTQSPVDRTLFYIVEALKAVDDAAARPVPPRAPRKRRAVRKFTPTRGQRSLIRAAFSSGMTPRAVAKSLKMPLGLVEAVLKCDEG